MTYTCKPCQRTFKTIQHLNEHKSSIKHQLCVDKSIKLFACDECGKKYMYKTGLSTHKKKCTSTMKMDELVENQKKLEKHNKELEQERIQLRKQIEELLDKFSQFQGQSTVNTTNNTNNIGTQNNIHIHINAFGKENMDYITNEFMGECVKKIYNSVPSLLQKIHFDPEHPENHNIKITNKKLPHASVMSEDQQWKLVNKQDAIEDMIDKGYNMIDEKFREDPSIYTEEKRKNYRKYQDNYDNEDKDTLKRLKNDVEYVILNGTKEIHSA